MPRKSLELSVADFIHSIGVLVRRIRAASVGGELSLSEAAVLGRLDREGSATTAELARSEGVKPQSMGATVAALERRGLLARKPHPSDGRQHNLEITSRGLALRKSRIDAKRTWLAQLVSQLNEDERETLFRAGEIIERLANGASTEPASGGRRGRA